jgi:hypothetical protein
MKKLCFSVFFGDCFRNRENKYGQPQAVTTQRVFQQVGLCTGNHEVDHNTNSERSCEIMKNAKVENRKIIKATQQRRVAGVPVRSGVKAGHYRDEKLGGESRLGGPDIPGRLF